ncbi:MAG: hypothetical protein KDK65_03885 [Chlamydiia bacterium]|nr:hypothetical protein [Chlamydiia bacterium]
MMRLFCCLLCFVTPLLGEHWVKFDFPNPAKKWKENYEAQEKQMRIIEYIPEEENADKWTEMVTVQSFDGVNTEPEKFFDLMIKELQQRVPNNEVSHRLIIKKPDQLLAEWWIDDHSPSDQRELIRIFQVDDTLLALRYTTNSFSDTALRRKIWTEVLKNAQVTASETP